MNLSRRSFAKAASGLFVPTLPAIIHPALAGNPMMLGSGKKAVAGGATVTWNPADKAAGVTLSGGNLTAHMASDTDYVMSSVRATTSFSSGKKFFRVVIDDITAPVDPDWNVGIVKIGVSLTAYLYSATGGVAIGNRDTGIYVDGAYQATIPAYAAADVMDVAIDFDNLKIWMRKNNTGNWNGTGTADPGTNTEGAAIASGTYYPIYGGFNGTGVTARFVTDGTTPPSGFSWWG